MASRRQRAAAALLFAVLGFSREVRGQGGNDACPAIGAEADDVREMYDEHGRLRRELRLAKGRLVQDTSVAYDPSGHAIERVELGDGRVRIARTRWVGDQVALAECMIDGRVRASVRYCYDDDHLVFREDSEDGKLVRSTSYRYDEEGRLVHTETRGADGALVSSVTAERAPSETPVHVIARAGGTYQSDTNLFDATAALGVHRKAKIERYGGDPLEVALDGALKFNRAKGVTNADQMTARLAVDYNLVLPRLSLFTFLATDRNLPANLKLNLEQAFLGVKVDIVPRGHALFDASLAPLWNLRSILSPPPDAPPGTPPVDRTTSTLRGSLRLRAGYRSGAYGLTDTVEFMPFIVGDVPVPETSVWDRAIFRNTVALRIELTARVAAHQEVKYTRDLALRAQAACDGVSSSLCHGYTFSSLTSLSLTFDL